MDDRIRLEPETVTVVVHAAVFGELSLRVLEKNTGVFGVLRTSVSSSAAFTVAKRLVIPPPC
jgi:hypothetical protein